MTAFRLCSLKITINIYKYTTYTNYFLHALKKNYLYENAPFINDFIFPKEKLSLKKRSILCIMQYCKTNINNDIRI